ncbi:MAG: DMT family transporter [Burkholderiaceae bacterium]
MPISPAQTAILFVSLSAIWGASFLFLRLSVPDLGSWLVALLRVLLAFLALGLVGLIWRLHRLRVQVPWQRFALIGLLNSAVPFALYSYAAKSMLAGYMAILNALVPMWAGLLAVVFLKERLRPTLLFSVVLAMTGIVVLVGLSPVDLTTGFLLAALACVGATVCYAIAGILTRRWLEGVSSFQSALYSLAFASAALLPFGVLQLPQAHFSLKASLAVCAVALLCSAFAYLLFFRLIRAVGPTKATTVTFMIPAFGVLWGSLFLGEPLTVNVMIGFLMVALASLIAMRWA